jgi:hypothetical protein
VERTQPKPDITKMWAAFTSDLAEFATGAAEETTAAASKVGVDIKIPTFTDDGEEQNASGVGSGFASSAGQQGVDGSVMFANAALSMGEKGLKGLAGMSSMVGGMVAPRGGNDSAPGGGGGVTSYNNSSAAAGKPSAFTSMLAAGEDDEEEEELGWDDDDDDDLDVDIASDNGGADNGKNAVTTDDFFDEQLGEEGEKSSSQPHAAVISKDASSANNVAISSSQDKEVMQALQTKLDAVEQSRAELQSEHRRQTAELVELRSKVEELEEKSKSSPSGDAVPDGTPSEGGGSSNDAGELEALQEQIEQLKLQLADQKKDLTEEHEQALAALIQEKAQLEEELKTQKEQTLQAQASSSSSNEEQQEVLKQYQQQIKDLTSELTTLQTKYVSTSTELDQAKDQSAHQGEIQEEAARVLKHTKSLEQSLSVTKASHASAQREAEEAKAKLITMEREVQDAKDEMEKQAAEFAIRLREEVAKAKTSVQSVAAEEDIEEQDEKKPIEDDAAANEIAVEKAPSNPVKIGDSDEELSDDWGDGDWGGDDA